MNLLPAIARLRIRPRILATTVFCLAALSQAGAQSGPSLTKASVTPLHLAKGGQWGVLFQGTATGINPGGTKLLVSLREATGSLATLDRASRAPDGGLGAQVKPKADGPVEAFIPFRAIGLPAGKYALIAQSALAGPGPRDDILSAWIDAPKVELPFVLDLAPCRPDRLEVSPGHDASGRRLVEFKFDITAEPLRGRKGFLRLKFKTTTGQPFAGNAAPHHINGQLATTAPFTMPKDDTILDGLRLAIPFDLFPQGTDECLMDIEFTDESLSPVGALLGVPIRLRD